VQVVVALVVTTEGFPLAYEVLSGNTSDKTTLRAFLAKIEQQYGKAERIWVMDRGIPTEEVLAEMRANDPPVFYVVGTPKQRLNKLESQLTEKPWSNVRTGIDVKLLAQDGELYVLAQSHDRINKERAMRRRQLKWLWKRFNEISNMKSLSRDSLLLKLGAAKNEAPAAWRLVQIHLPTAKQSVTKETFRFSLLKDQLRAVRKREGRYLLRTNLTGYDPAKLWEFYTQLTQVEEAFKNLKGDLAIRPIYHQKQERIEAHIFVSFLAYCLHVTLRQTLKPHAPGLTPRSILEKFKTMQMIDVQIPTKDNRILTLPRYTQPEPELQLLINTLKLTLPDQPPPKISAQGQLLQK
jgi:transposase